MTLSVLLVSKSGDVQACNIKTFQEETLFKRAGFKSANGFEKHTVFTHEGFAYNVHVYGKSSGRAGQENKYEFPPPLDKTLFFGTCLLVAKDSTSGDPVPITPEKWALFYEALMGGFEDIVDTEEEEEEEEELSTDVSMTKDHYVKDGFVVDDDEEEEEEEEILVVPVKKKIKSVKKTESARKKNVFVTASQAILAEETPLTAASSELVEEDYL
jgi:hypothetical protein